MGKQPVHQESVLLACPFCGCEDVRTPTLQWNGEEIPRCSDCGAEAPSVELWNRRAPDAVNARLLAAAKFFCEHQPMFHNEDVRREAAKHYVAIVEAEKASNPGLTSTPDPQ